ncbi:hypothetical protein OCU04_004630 [Sclerotinia nivalis]|uniref:Zn(2)-C6 fungal-type domain-containing protein n=1 Tax=Sclerotinia nivalis TaxID=352851 RepID=A0A9X0ARL6_9HELO|nr:hypothetical protein OCU04_004630 [Sclerotinia nivalis]
MNSHPPGDRPSYHPPIQPSPSSISHYASSSATLERPRLSCTGTVTNNAPTLTGSLLSSGMSLQQQATYQGILKNPYALSNGRSHPPSSPALRDNLASHSSPNNGSQYHNHIRQDAPDNRVSHRTSNEPQHPADNRMAPSNPFNRTRYNTSPTLEYHPQSGWSQGTHPSNGYPELYQTRPNNGPQYPGQSIATSQDGRYPPTGYDAPPPYAYHDGRGYTQEQAPSAQPMAFKQSAPRQRTAIACKYCRRRKIRCTGFNADGSGGKCSNCTRFRQECIFTPVSSAQAFVPLEALYAAKGGAVGPDQQVYGAHGQPMPKEFLEQSPPASHQMFRPPQSTFDPHIPQDRRRMSRPHHPVHLAPLTRSPYNQDATLPSPTDSLDSQKRKRETDEQHYARLPPSGQGQFYEYQRGENILPRLPAIQGEQHRSSFPPPALGQHFGYQQGENTLAYRPMEESRQLAPVNPYEVPRKSPSPNGSASSFNSQIPGGYYPPSQFSPHRSELPYLPQGSPLGTSLGAGFSHPMAISNVIAQDNKDIDRNMLGRLGQGKIS